MAEDDTSSEAEPEVSDTIETTSTPKSKITLNTSYDIDESGRVSFVEFSDSDGHKCTAKIREDDPAYYDYTSTLLFDEEPVTAPLPLSLADVILTAYVHLGLIPPHQFDSIPCRNKH